MSKLNLTLLLAAGSGVITGMRSMTLPALLSRRLSLKYGGGAVTQALAEPHVASLLSVLAAGEMLGDKTPIIPDRTKPVALAGRAIIAGICGAAIAERRGGSRLGFALISSLTAVGSTFLSYKLRKKAGLRTRIPDPMLGLAEDVLVLLTASGLMAAFEE